MKRLVSTAKRPEIEIACPACPSVMPRSPAIGVRRLTGMNSEAIRTATQSAIEATAPQACARLDQGLVVGSFHSHSCGVADPDEFEGRSVAVTVKDSRGGPVLD